MDTEYTKGFKAGYDFGYKDAANENRYNTGVKVGISAERERIIKLLDGLQNQYAEDYWQLDELIELIKGETK